MKFESKITTDEEVLSLFRQSLKAIQTRHSNVVQTMAQGVLELRDSHTVDKQTDMAIQYFLDRFYMSRISISSYSVKLYKLLVKAHTAL